LKKLKFFSILKINENPNVVVFNSDATLLNFDNKNIEEKKDDGETNFNALLLYIIVEVIEKGNKDFKENYFIIFLTDGNFS
jgi:hypothetical protein